MYLLLDEHSSLFLIDKNQYFNQDKVFEENKCWVDISNNEGNIQYNLTRSYKDTFRVKLLINFCKLVHFTMVLDTTTNNTYKDFIYLTIL